MTFYIVLCFHDQIPKDIVVCHNREAWQSGSAVSGAGRRPWQSSWRQEHVASSSQEAEKAGQEAEKAEEPGAQL